MLLRKCKNMVILPKNRLYLFFLFLISFYLNINFIRFIFFFIFLLYIFILCINYYTYLFLSFHIFYMGGFFNVLNKCNCYRCPLLFYYSKFLELPIIEAITIILCISFEGSVCYAYFCF